MAEQTGEQQGTQAYNIGRLCAYTGGLPESVLGMALDRMCASGLMSIGNRPSTRLEDLAALKPVCKDDTDRAMCAMLLPHLRRALHLHAHLVPHSR